MVTSAEGAKPVAGVQVFVSGRTGGGLTGDDGRYSLTVQPGTYKVQARRIGFAPDSAVGVVVPAGGTATANFSLVPLAVVLTQQVVIGYGTQQAREVTGAVATVSQAEFNTGRIVTPEQLIQAKVPGVQVISNNEPGGGVTIRVRGGTSINAANDPLFVIDGVPLAVGGGISDGRNPLSFINPNDIETVTVLKDASATAIYGSRGANGVVLITTKTGSEGSEVTYSVSTSTSSVVRQPQLLNASQFRAAVTQFAPTNIDSIGAANTDWQKAVQRTAVGQQHDLAFSGGRDALRYRLSLGYLDQAGVVRGTDAQRVSASLNYSDRLFKDILEVHTNLKGSRGHDLFTPGGVVGAAIAFAPTQPIYRTPGVFLQYKNPLGANNPVADLAQLSDQGTIYRSVGDIEGRYHAPFLDGLVATVRGGYDVARSERTSFSPSFSQGQLENSLGGTFTRNTPTQLNTLLEAFGEYAHRLERMHSDINVTGGYSFERFNNDETRVFAQGLSTDLLTNGGIPGATTQQNAVNQEEARLVSFFGRATYTLRDKYIFTASVRRDGSSRFGPTNQWGVFPSASIAWRIIDEPFMQRWGKLSDLKLRASWGVNGNQAFGNYLYLSTYQIGDNLSQVQFGNQFVTTIRPTAVDPNIKWEQTTSTDVGLDYGFLNNRISGTIDAYTKKTTDLIFRVPVAAGTNLSNFVTTNIGSVQNRGIEFGINARVIDHKNGGFTWDAGFNAATNSNKLLSLYGGSATQILIGAISGGVGSSIQVLQPGYPVNSFFVYKHKALNAAGATADRPDTALYVDVNGDHIINGSDLQPYKSPWPKWQLAQSSQMSWRNFDASYTLRANLGSYVYNNVASNLGHYSAVKGSQPPSNLESSVLTTNFVGPQYFSDLYVEDASFLRMDNLTLGYTFRKLRAFKAVRVFGSVQNVFTITGYSGVDPEAATVGLTSAFGIDNNIYPRSRTLLLGAAFTF
ncbi:MAG: SusC/RagA family TonB-linked outer membrane protein [Gemmatimonadota bacterium]|nr:SusC/RagA family TonB-linked outer membrane protein [Gemmatimonadota bacterium]